MRNVLIYFALKYSGDYHKIFKAIKEKEKIDAEYLEKIKNSKINAITLIDEEYPLCLKRCYAPPFVLFYKGDISLLRYDKMLAVIGSRTPSYYGKKVTQDLLNQYLLENDILVISGLARGIDAISHECALNNNRKTIAILGNGVDVYYPKENAEIQKRIEKEGLIISEYPSLTSPQKDYFPLRNRLIASLAKYILVTDAKIKSGTRITVGMALDEGKEIYTIPHPIYSKSYCNELIKQGANVVLSIDDLKDLFI